MSEVWKSYTYSSQMRLLGETPYMQFRSQTRMETRVEESVRGLVEADSM